MVQRGLTAPCYSAPEANDEAFALLRRMKDDLRLVSSELFGAIKQWFVARCPDWTVESSTIDDDGACAADPNIRLTAVRFPARLSAASSVGRFPVPELPSRCVTRLI